MKSFSVISATITALFLFGGTASAQENMIEVLDHLDDSTQVMVVPVQVVKQLDEETVEVMATGRRDDLEVPVVFTVRLNTPMKLSLAVGFSWIVMTEDTIRPFYAEAEAGLGGGMLSMGYGAFGYNEGSSSAPSGVIGFGIRASYFKPWNQDYNGNYLGLQADIALAGARVNLGVLRKLSGDENAANFLLAAGFGYAVGFPR